MSSSKILVVEKNKEFSHLLRVLLSFYELRPDWVPYSSLARERLKEHPYRLLITEYFSDDSDGVELADYGVRFGANPELKVMVLTQACLEGAPLNDIYAKGYHYLERPFRPDDFYRQVLSLLKESGGLSLGRGVRKSG